MHKSFRFEPTTARASRVIPRARLTRLLAERFEHRLTTLVASAGSGKTTAAAQAVANNRLDPDGVDIWLGLTEADSDPVHLLAGVAEALGLEPSGGADATLPAIAEAIWSRAPERVSLLLDDVHLVEDSTAPAELLAALPANASLVLIGRRIPPIPLAELRARHDIVEITERDIELDVDELTMLVAARGRGDPHTLSRHAASADLGLTAGPTAGIDYLWEEILSNLPAWRLAALSSLAVLDEVDDALAYEITGGQRSALEISEGLPLVEHHEDGSVRLHELLRSPLLDRLTDDDRDRTLRVCARLELDRGRYAAAAELAAKLPDRDLLVEAARSVAMLPMLRSRVDVVRRLVWLLSEFAPDAAVHELLQAHHAWEVSADELARWCRRAADAAAAEGDGELEAVALYRAIQAQAAAGEVSRDLPARIGELADDVPWARGVYGHLVSQSAQLRGDAAESLAALDQSESLPSETLQVMRAERLCDLGRPELVAVGISTDDLGRLPQGAEVFIAFAMWLRGDSLPEPALEFGLAMRPSMGSQGQLEPQVSYLCVLTHIALAAGELDTARDLLDEARSRVDEQRNRRAAQFVALASAVASLESGDEPGCVEVMEALDLSAPFGKWPERPALLALPLMYLYQPASRTMLDTIEVGPALALAIRAGRALVALREHDDPEPATQLPWSDETILRVHVPPALLAELAGAAAALGSSAAAGLLQRLPNQRHGLERLTERGGDIAEWARRQLDDLPTEPPFRLRVRALGQLQLLRDDEIVDGAEWARARVRQLMGLLVERRKLPREQAMAALWPEQDSSKAGGNFRVHLSFLQRALEPDRSAEERPAFLHVDSYELRLAEVVEIDVDEFEAELAQAQQLDNAGSPADAVVHYERALALYGGPYLQEVDAEWAEVTRLRLERGARTAQVRLAELELARGEPERALEHAFAAWHLHALDERAARVVVAAMAGSGDRAGAISAGQRLLADFAEAKVTPEAATHQALRRVGIEI